MIFNTLKKRNDFYGVKDCECNLLMLSFHGRVDVGSLVSVDRSK